MELAAHFTFNRVRVSADAADFGAAAVGREGESRGKAQNGGRAIIVGIEAVSRKEEEGLTAAAPVVAFLYLESAYVITG